MPLFILKIGGSIATFKNRAGVSVRRSLLKKIAKNIKLAQKKGDFGLVVIHGAGAAGHQLAHKYNLKDGAKEDAKRWKASLDSRLLNQKLNANILEIFLAEGLRMVSVHTASVVIQNSKEISKLNMEIIRESLRNNCIPLLYGEMVFDEKLGMTICSGDALAPYLAKNLEAEKIFFATDVDGIFDKDPYCHKNACLIRNMKMESIEKGHSWQITGSHNVDTTGGLAGKMNRIMRQNFSSLKSIEIFNGAKDKNFSDALLGKRFLHTKISLK